MILDYDLWSPKKLCITFIFYFAVFVFRLCNWYDPKTAVAFTGSFNFIVHLQISDQNWTNVENSLYQTLSSLNKTHIK